MGGAPGLPLRGRALEPGQRAEHRQGEHAPAQRRRLGEVPASRIRTAELDMQTAPAAAAAVGGIVVTRTGPLPSGLS